MRSTASLNGHAKVRTIYLGESNHKTYLLDKKPVSPWDVSRDDPRCALTLDALDFYVNLCSWKERYFRDKFFPAAMVHYFLEQKGEKEYKYVPCAENGSEFGEVSLNDTTVTFDKDSFYSKAKDESRETMEVSNLDISMVIVDCTAIAGERLSVGTIVSEADIVALADEEGAVHEYYPRLFLEKAYVPSAKEAVRIDSIGTHYVAIRVRDDERRIDDEDEDDFNAVVPWDIFDGCVALPGVNGGYQFSEGLPFTGIDSYFANGRDASAYRETWVMEGTSCIGEYELSVIHGEKTDSSERELQINHGGIPFRGIQFVGGIFSVKPKDRTNFDKTVQKDVPVGGKQDRCHSISYDFICNCISTILNNYMKNKNLNNLEICLRQMIDMVFVDLTTSNSFHGGAVICADEIKKAVVKAGTLSAAQKDVLDWANIFIKQLNNSICNLRAGSSSWNRSIGQAFDPSAWAYIDNRRGTPMILGDNTMLRYNFPQSVPAGLYPAIPRVEGLFLTDANDGYRIQYIIYSSSNYGTTPLEIWKAREARTGYVYLYSSSNAFSRPHAEDTKCEVYYIYTEPGSGRKRWMLL